MGLVLSLRNPDEFFKGRTEEELANFAKYGTFTKPAGELRPLHGRMNRAKPGESPDEDICRDDHDLGCCGGRSATKEPPGDKCADA